MIFKRFIAAVAVAVGGFSAATAETTYTLNATKQAAATSILNALDWNTAANWSPATVPNDKTAYASIGAPKNTSVCCFITSAVPITVSRVGYKSTPSYLFKNTYVSEQPLTLTAGARYSNGLYFYAPVRIQGVTPYFRNVAFCGPIQYSSSSVNVLEDYYNMYHRFDLWADSAGQTREQPYSGGGGMSLSGASGHFYGPESSATDGTGCYRLTAGSPYAFLASGARPVLPVGTIVTCAGALPAGTFLKRIFPDESIELSQPAIKTLSSATLTFAAFTPSVRQTFALIRDNGKDNIRLYLNKYRAEDTLVISTPNFNWPNADTKYGYGSGTVTIDTAAGFHPGVLATCGFKKVECETDSKACLYLCRCELEIAPSSGLVHDEYVKVYQESTAHVSGISVAEERTVNLKHVRRWAGTFVKRGEGTLAMNVDASVSSLGSLQVLEGRCSLTVPDGVDTLASLTVASGAEFVVPATGLKAKSVTFGAGAIVTGGTLSVPGMKNPDNPGVICREGAQIVYQYDPDGSEAIRDVATWTTLPEPLRSQAAFWVDADNADTLTTVTSGSKTYVSRVNDVRGTEANYNFATNVVNRPQLETINRNHRMIHFYGRVVGTGETMDVTKIDTLLWAWPVYGIRHVFQVCERGRTTSGGRYLGTSSRVPTGVFVRTTGTDWTTPIFHTSAAACVQNGTFRMLDQVYPAFERGFGYITEAIGQLKDTTPMYPDKYNYAPFVSSLELAPSYPAADNFDWDEAAVGRYGQKGLCELIVFTNAVSVADRQAITEYLAKKWNGCELAHFAASNADGDTLGTAKVDGDLSLSVAAGGSLVVSNVTGGATFTKGGAGTLCVEDYANPTGTIRVTEGTLEIAAPLLTKAALPEGALVHLDATDLSSMTCIRELGKTNLTVWADTRGSGYPKATLRKPSSTQKPFLRANVLNGLPFVDFGAFCYDSAGDPANTSEMTIVETNGLHSLFAVWGSRNGGGTGLIGSGYWPYNGGMGLARGGDSYGKYVSEPIIKSDAHTPSFGGNFSYGYRFRLNGVAADPTIVAFSGTNDLVSLVSYEPFGMEGLSGFYYHHYYGGEEIGEYIVYERALSDANALKVEAYLRKKWYNADTPGCRAPVAGDVILDAGATLKLRGGGALTVRSLTGAGSVDGSVACASNAVLEVTVNADGSVTPLVMTGELDLSAGATIRLVGSTGVLTTGKYTAVRTGGLTLGPLTLDAQGVKKDRSCRLVVDGDNLVLNVLRGGFIVIYR